MSLSLKKQGEEMPLEEVVTKEKGIHLRSLSIFL